MPAAAVFGSRSPLRRVILGVLAAVALVAGCEKAAPPKVALPPAEVKLLQTRATSVPVRNEYVGRIAAYR